VSTSVILRHFLEKARDERTEGFTILATGFGPASNETTRDFLIDRQTVAPERCWRDLGGRPRVDDLFVGRCRRDIVEVEPLSGRPEEGRTIRVGGFQTLDPVDRRPQGLVLTSPSTVGLGFP
jgi:hypothetical protein